MLLQPVGQLDHEHADVLGHGQDQLADVLRLLHGPRLEIHLADLGHAVHDVGHVRAEQILDLVHRGVGILHGVVQQARGHGGLVQLHVGQEIGHVHGMRYVRLARTAHHAVVGLGGKNVCPLDQVQVGLVDVCRHLVGDLIDANHKPYCRSCSVRGIHQRSLL